MQSAHVDDQLLKVQRAIVGSDLSGAVEICERLVAEFPNSVSAHMMLCRLQLIMRNPEKALASAERASLLSPRDPEVLLQLAQCFIKLGRRNSATIIAVDLSQQNLVRAEQNDALGTILTLCAQPSRALPFHERAVALAPDNHDFAFNCAAVKRMTGDLAGAEKILDWLVLDRRADVRSYYMRSDLRRQTPESNHIAEMIKLQESGVKSADDRIMLGFAIAKELEDVGSYESSIAQLHRANLMQRQRMRYAVQDDIDVINRLIDRHPGPAGSVDSALGAGCIFVMGLPRTGTTLVERLLTNGTGVVAGGELPDFAEVSVRALTSQFGPMPRLEFVDRLLLCDPAEIGRNYLSSVSIPLGGAERFVDKLPANYLYAGIIRRALPAARIILVAREPMDACYAVFKTLFSNAYPFSYDLSDLGHYYIAWERLVRHWQTHLGEAVLTLQYERLVSDTATSVRRLFDHCNLPWDERALHLEGNRSAVSTASATQVLRPVYSSSIGQWRHYEDALRPLRDVLLNAGVALNSQLGN
jgi:tetratricopeptide (TPR) repeat protein